MKKSIMQKLVLSRLNKGKTDMPKINITYIADRAVISYKTKDNEEYKAHINIYYGFLFVYRLNMALKRVHFALKSRLNEEVKKR